MALSYLRETQQNLTAFFVAIHAKGEQRAPDSVVSFFQQLKESPPTKTEEFLIRLRNCVQRITHPTPWQTVLDFFKTLFHLGPVYADFHHELGSKNMRAIRDYLSQQISKKHAEEYFSYLEGPLPINDDEIEKQAQKALTHHEYVIGGRSFASVPLEQKEQRYFEFCTELQLLNGNIPLPHPVFKNILLACQRDAVKPALGKASEVLSPLWEPIETQNTTFYTISKTEDGSWSLSLQKNFLIRQKNSTTILKGLEIRTTTQIQIASDGSPLFFDITAKQVSPSIHS